MLPLPCSMQVGEPHRSWQYHQHIAQLRAGDTRGMRYSPRPLSSLSLSLSLSLYFDFLFFHSFLSFHSSLLSIQYLPSPPVLVEFPMFRCVCVCVCVYKRLMFRIQTAETRMGKRGGERKQNGTERREENRKKKNKKQN